jgi:hypothetical protein
MDNKRFPFLFFLLILAGAFCFSIVQIPTEELPEEKYTYEAAPKGKEKSKNEIIEMEFFHSSEQTACNQRILQPDGQEVIKIEMLPDGSFLQGTKYFMNEHGKTIKTVRIVRENGIVSIMRHLEEKTERKNIKLPSDKVLAVDASLLVLMRKFPFDQESQWDVFMVDFSRQSVSVSIRQAGVEKVILPSGEFECYRMEVVVKVFIFRPKIIFWITKTPPHFLVKHKGKRGPFTPEYITSLVSRDM